MTSQTFPPIRRIVTGHDGANVAKVIIDGQPLNVKHGAAGNQSTLIWCTDSMPADIAVGESVEDMGSRKLGTAPPPHGSRVTLIDFPAGCVSAMHRTETIDYVFVLAGEIDMDMDDSTVKMKAGDVMVQRGTNHSWVNRSDHPARLAFVLLDGKPLGIGHAVQGSASAS